MSKKSKKWLWLLLIGGLAAAASLQWQPWQWFAAKPSTQNSMAANPNTAEPVNVAHPVRRVVTLWDEYTGRFQAEEEVAIKARVSGYLEQIPYQEGAKVKQGEPLFVLDQRPFVAAVEQKQGELARAEAEVKLKQRDFQRFDTLSKKSFTAESERDRALFELEQAKAYVQVAQAELALAKLDLTYATITAPIDGVTGEHEVTVGNLIVGGDNSTLLTTIVSMDPIDFVFEIDESHFLEYQRARKHHDDSLQTMRFQVRLMDETDFGHSGTFTFVDNQFDKGTGSILIKISLDNKDGLFVPGQFAKVRVADEQDTSVLLLPERVIQNEQTRRYVYTVKDGKVVRTYIEVGENVGAERIVRSGLQDDDQVIMDDILKQYPGKPVKVQLKANNHD